MISRWRSWVSVQVVHDFYRSGSCEELHFAPAPDTASAAPQDESALNPIEPASKWRFLVRVGSSEFYAVTELTSAGPLVFSNGAGSVLSSSAGPVGSDVRQAGAFGVVELIAPGSGWPQLGTGGGHDVVEEVSFSLAFTRRNSIWRYHVVLKPGDVATDTLSVVYAPPTTGPWPAGITFDPMTAPPEVQASYPGRAIASFTSSAPLPFHESALPKTALRRGGKTLITDLPNPRWQPSAGPTDVLVELR